MIIDRVRMSEVALGMPSVEEISLKMLTVYDVSEIHQFQKLIIITFSYFGISYISNNNV